MRLTRSARALYCGKIILFALFLLMAVMEKSIAQQDSVIFEKDTVILQDQDTLAMKSYAARYDPRKALLYAAVIPGLGQVYNKKYWKLPLIYGGAYLIGNQINSFNKAYIKFRAQLFENLKSGNDPNKQNPTSRLTTSQLRTLTDKARRGRDFWIIMVGTLYVLQIVDAHVDSHLKEFDLNPNLRVSVEPIMDQNQVLGRQTGFSIITRF